MSPYWLVCGKPCHLPIKLEHKSYWAIKQCKLAYDLAGKERKLQLQEQGELRLDAYDNSMIYKGKGKAKAFHDAKFSRNNFKWVKSL